MAVKKKTGILGPLIVLDGDSRLKVTPDGGWFVGESLDVRGLIVQAKTLEQLIIDAREVGKLLKESREAWRRENAGRTAPRKRRTA